MVLRAAGPSLWPLGVSGVLADPKLERFAGSTKTGENDNWDGSTALASAMSAVGAFAFSGPASRDAAASVALSAGDQSMTISGVGGGTGLVLAEVPVDAGDLTYAELVAALKAVVGSPKPVVVHCWHGSDRTGAVVAGWRVAMQGWTPAAALDEMVKAIPAARRILNVAAD